MIHIFAATVSLILAVVAGYAAALRLEMDVLRAKARKATFRAARLEDVVARQRKGIDRLVDVNSRDIRDLTYRIPPLLCSGDGIFEEDE